MRNINEAGLNLLKTFEGCELAAYRDQGGIWTIGYGHTGSEVVSGMQITQNQAEDLLNKDLEKFYELDEYISERINDNQYSALICLAYNVGLLAIRNSTLLKCVNAGESPDTEWMKWDHVNGVVDPGLTKRRKAELTLYHELG